MKKRRIISFILLFTMIFSMWTGQSVYATENEQEMLQENDSDSQLIDSDTEGQNENKTDDISGQDSELQTTNTELQTGNNEEVPNTEIEAQSNDLSVIYQAHVQNIGWQSAVADGAQAGTTGKNLQLEAVKIKLDNATGVQGSIEYAAHVQDIGWQSKVAEDGLSGTEGKNKAIEALRINLTGELSNQYDVYYRVHATNYGWLAWTKNGSPAGTKGFAYSVQAIEIKLVLKGSSDAPEVSEKAYIANEASGTILYQAHVQDIGWMQTVSDGAVSGTVGRNKNMESLKVTLSDSTRSYGDITGEVEYQVYLNSGWTSKKSEGYVAGTTGRNTPIQAIRINLTEQLAQMYDIYYRVHSANYGWLGWAKNGESAGAIDMGCPMQAIEIKLYAKGSSNCPAQDDASYVSEDSLGTIIYKTHVADIGWQKSVWDGALAGTTGQSKQVEAINIRISEVAQQNGLEGNIIYQSHVQDYGWMAEVQNGELSGTEGKNKQMEAIRIRLDGAISNSYSVYYRVHSSNFGWLGWAKDGEYAGTVGYGQQIEAIQIKLVAKDSSDAPEQTIRSYLSKDLIGQISSEAYVEGSGWQSAVYGNGIIGTTGQDLSIQALKINITSGNGSISDKYSGGIQYSLHVEDYGWMSWQSNGTVAGTVGENKRAEAIKIKLTGELAQYADIYYRAHVSKYGWLGWASNGEPAGTSKCEYELQAIEIKIVPKYTGTSMVLGYGYTETPKVEWIMGLRSDLYSSTTPYLILVNRGEHKVGIFQGWQGNWNCIQYWDCTTGAPSTPTVTGIFKVGAKGYYFDSFGVRCFWYTQFYNDYLFHSVCYNKNGTLYDGRLGMSLSHGCVRLDINNAKWIYDNIPTGTTVVVYN